MGGDEDNNVIFKLVEDEPMELPVGGNEDGCDEQTVTAYRLV